MAKDLENTMNGNNIHLLTQINAETTNGLIIQMTQWLNNLSFTKQGDMFYQEKQITPAAGSTLRIINAKKAVDRIYTPDEKIPDHIPVLNIWINCSGGNSLQTQSILNILHIASARGAIIRTYNIGRASSSASMIAVSGTKGYRFMGEYAYNFIHYGNSNTSIDHPKELEFAFKDIEMHHGQTREIYLNNTKLSDEEISQYFDIKNSGQLFAKECLEKGICDWIVTNDGRFVNNVNDLKQNQR